MQQWKKSFDHFFGDQFWHSFEHIMQPPIPQTNIYQMDKELTCYVNIPGLDSVDAIKVYIKGNRLFIIGDIPLGETEGQIIQQEIMHGAFERSIDLPYPVRADQIHASYRAGLLIIRLHQLIGEDEPSTAININQID
ncbi:HSP20 family protein [Amphibacillus marinus]|uniref:HSP20 family protein n=1 Tax=Amphibacillus marinus TaxID=872970 RepID=A0A1H8LHE0_9BACI|nr:Hsp20/alpha crystallin family protein [Amphibacillus marinus]SEO04206.1 HSP20 family protein [Amphibacillus marinus]